MPQWNGYGGGSGFSSGFNSGFNSGFSSGASAAAGAGLSAGGFGTGYSGGGNAGYGGSGYGGMAGSPAGQGVGSSGSVGAGLSSGGYGGYSGGSSAGYGGGGYTGYSGGGYSGGMVGSSAGRGVGSSGGYGGGLSGGMGGFGGGNAGYGGSGSIGGMAGSPAGMGVGSSGGYGGGLGGGGSNGGMMGQRSNNAATGTAHYGGFNAANPPNYGRDFSPADQVYQDTLSRGYPANVAAGITGSLYGESGLDPNAVNPTSRAYGLGQMLGSRKRGMQSEYGPQPSMEQQLNYLDQEMLGTAPVSDPRSQQFRNAVVGSDFSPGQVAQMHMHMVERPGALDQARSLGKRQNFAQNVYNGNTPSDAIAGAQGTSTFPAAGETAKPYQDPAAQSPIDMTRANPIPSPIGFRGYPQQAARSRSPYVGSATAIAQALTGTSVPQSGDPMAGIPSEPTYASGQIPGSTVMQGQSPVTTYADPYAGQFADGMARPVKSQVRHPDNLSWAARVFGTPGGVNDYASPDLPQINTAAKSDFANYGSPSRDIVDSWPGQSPDAPVSVGSIHFPVMEGQSPTPIGVSQSPDPIGVSQSPEPSWVNQSPDPTPMQPVAFNEPTHQGGFMAAKSQGPGPGWVDMGARHTDTFGVYDNTPMTAREKLAAALSGKSDHVFLNRGAKRNKLLMKKAKFIRR